MVMLVRNGKIVGYFGTVESAFNLALEIARKELGPCNAHSGNDSCNYYWTFTQRNGNRCVSFYADAN